MMNSKIYFRFIILLIILVFIFIFKNNIFYLLSYTSILTKENNNNLLTENNILKNKCAYLEDELNNLTDIKNYASYNYELTRMNYRLSYLSDEINISNTNNIKVNASVVNQFGLVGIVKTIKEDYSFVTLLTGINNLSVNINDAYGTLSDYENNYFVIRNITNYENVHINDEVYTSTLGNIKEKIYIGKVIDIKLIDIEKIIYVKSDVDFNNLNYLYVVG